jgi:hypothetical protein
MKKINATHVLLSLVLVALVLNLVMMMQVPVRASAALDDMSDVVDKMDRINDSLNDMSSHLDGMSDSLSKMADADLFELSSTTPGSSTYGLPVVVVEK